MKTVDRVKLLKAHDGIPSRLQVIIREGAISGAAFTTYCTEDNAKVIAKAMGKELE